MKVIIYNQDNGTPAVVVPSVDTLQKHTIIEIAIKDVPPGKRFKIVDSSELPLDAPQDAWIVNDEDLTDGIGGDTNEFN